MSTENNKIIAEFMGWTNKPNATKDYFHNSGTPYGTLHIKYLKFDSDWNWLMEVVEKIETTSYNVPENLRRGFMKNTLTSNGIVYSDYDDRKEFLGWSSYCTLGTQTLWDSTMLGEDVKKYGSKIEAVYNACVEFIKWYNQQNNKPC